MVKYPPANAGDIRDPSLILDLEDALEKGVTTHSSVLAWRIPWTEEPGGLQPMGSQRVVVFIATIIDHILAWVWSP